MASDRYALVGRDVRRSLSPIIHLLFARQTYKTILYRKCSVLENVFEQQILHMFRAGVKGINITSPFKIRAYQMCDRATQSSETLGCANTLWYQDGLLWADNTDVTGFCRDWTQFAPAKAINKVLVLGAGGAARAVIAGLLALGVSDITISNRTKDTAALLADNMGGKYASPCDTGDAYDAVINATSISTTQGFDIFSKTILQSRIVYYDLAYNLSKNTAFLAWVKQHLPELTDITDGLGMLVEQAADAFRIWRKTTPDTKSVRDYFRLVKKSNN